MVVGEEKNLAGFGISHLPEFEDVGTQVLPIDLALQQLFSQKASVNAADKLVVEHFCTQIIGIAKFIDLGKLLHFSWCQVCCDNLHQLFILPFWMFFLS